MNRIKYSSGSFFSADIFSIYIQPINRLGGDLKIFNFWCVESMLPNMAGFFVVKGLIGISDTKSASCSLKSIFKILNNKSEDGVP